MLANLRLLPPTLPTCNMSHSPPLTPFAILSPGCHLVLIPVAERAKARVFARSLRDRGSNPSGGVGGVDMSVSCKCFVLSSRSLCSAYHQSRGVLPIHTQTHHLVGSTNHEVQVCTQLKIIPIKYKYTHVLKNGARILTMILNNSAWK